MTITHKLTQHYAVTTPPRYLTAGNACKSRFIVIIPFPLTAPIVENLRGIRYVDLVIILTFDLLTRPTHRYVTTKFGRSMNEA